MNSFEPRHVPEGLRLRVTRGQARARTRADALLSRVSSIISADTPPTCASGAPDAALQTAGLPQVAALIYELLDAHDDTAQLAAELEWDPFWRAHLEYLRALQRTGREALAQMSLGDVA